MRVLAGTWAFGLLITAMSSGCARGSNAPFDGGGGAIAESAVEQEAAPDRVCRRYLGCVAALTPEALPSAIDAFGAQASCWRHDMERGLCARACRSAAKEIERCGDCDEDDDCPKPGEACVDHVCESSDCRVDARRIGALLDRACSCAATAVGSGCAGEREFLNHMFEEARIRGCAKELEIWAACEAEELVCHSGHIDLYATCPHALDALTACENTHEMLNCPPISRVGDRTG